MDGSYKFVQKNWALYSKHHSIISAAVCLATLCYRPWSTKYMLVLISCKILMKTQKLNVIFKFLSITFEANQISDNSVSQLLMCRENFDEYFECKGRSDNIAIFVMVVSPAVPAQGVSARAGDVSVGIAVFPIAWIYSGPFEKLGDG